MIFNQHIGGWGGASASVFAYGEQLTSTDSVYATLGAVRVDGVWDAARGGFSISPIREYDTWHLYASNGTAIKEIDVLVDAAMEISVEVRFSIVLYDSSIAFCDPQIIFAKLGRQVNDTWKFQSNSFPYGFVNCGNINGGADVQTFTSSPINTYGKTVKATIETTATYAHETLRFGSRLIVAKPNVVSINGSQDDACPNGWVGTGEIGTFQDTATHTFTLELMGIEYGHLGNSLQIGFDCGAYRTTGNVYLKKLWLE